MCCFCLVFQSYNPQQRVYVLFLFGVSVLQSPAESVCVVSVWCFSLTIPSRECMCCFCLVLQSYSPQQRVYVLFLFGVAVIQSPAESVCVVSVWCCSHTVPSRECMCCFCLVLQSYSPQQRVYVLFLFGVAVIQSPAESVCVVSVWCCSHTVPSRECMCCFCLVLQSYSPQQRVVSVLQSPAENILCYFCLVFQSYNPHQRVVSVLQSPRESSFSLTIPSREYCVLFLFGVSVLQSSSESSFSLTVPSRECVCVISIWCFSLTIPSREYMCCFCLVFQSYNPQQRVYVLFLFGVSVLQPPAESVCVVSVWCFSLTIPSRECMCCFCLVFQSYNPQQRVYVLFLFGVSVLQSPAESVCVVSVWCCSHTVPSRE